MRMYTWRLEWLPTYLRHLAVSDAVTVLDIWDYDGGNYSKAPTPPTPAARRRTDRGKLEDGTNSMVSCGTY